MRPVTSADKALDRYLAAMNSSATTTKYKEGINGVSESPMEKAIAAKDRYLSGVQAAVASGAYEEGLRSTSLSTYKANAIAKADRLASGANAASAKQRAFYQKAVGVWQQIRDGVASMPKGGKANALDRVGKALDLLATLKRGNKGTS